MRRAVAIAVVLAALVAVPVALALNPAPIVETWESFPVETDILETTGGTGISYVVVQSDQCTNDVQGDGFNSSRRVQIACFPTLFAAFDEGFYGGTQSYVAFRVRPHHTKSGEGPWTVRLTAYGQSQDEQLGAPVTRQVTDGQWAPIAIARTGIHFVTLTADSPADGFDGPFYLDVDDLAHSVAEQPDTEIRSGPAPLGASTSASFTFAGTPGSTFQCSLDNANFSGCSSGQGYPGLADGQHSFRVRAVNVYGTQDPTPASATWTVDTTGPDSRIDFGPPASTTSSGATFTFSSPDSDVTGFDCRLNDGAYEPCKSPVAYTNLPDGTHDFYVRAHDGLGNVDATPARHTWTISPPPVGTPREPVSTPPGTTTTTLPDAVDPCTAAGQPDVDGDGIPNSCETLSAGNVPAVAGVNAVVRALSGEVYVKLPGSASASYKQSGLEPGFVPLKGVASVPVGSTLDTRSGTASVSTAADFRAGTNRRHRAQTARFQAGIFRIKQARRRARVRAASRATTDLVLVSASNAESKCTSSGTESRKGVVRTLSGVGKGRFRTLGGAATVSTTNATWVVNDRCDGTVTQVGKGRAAVFDKARKRTVTVRAGQSYIAKARIFQAKKGRRSIR